MMKFKHAFKKKIKSYPELFIVVVFLLYIFIGTLLVGLDISKKNPSGFIDNLFITVSAVTTTGLTTDSLYSNYTFFGKLIILVLIKLGGLGSIIIGVTIVLTSKGHFSEEVKEVTSEEWAIPKKFNFKDYIKDILIFTFFIELVGAFILAGMFFFCRRSLPID